MDIKTLQDVSATLLKNAYSKLVVATEEQARQMTAGDPTGRAWQVGEQYYRLASIDGETTGMPRL